MHLLKPRRVPSLTIKESSVILLRGSTADFDQAQGSNHFTAEESVGSAADFVYREILASERWRSNKHRIGLTGQIICRCSPSRIKDLLPPFSPARLCNRGLQVLLDGVGMVYSSSSPPVNSR
ncbi:hypothetical protein LINPERHAP2_LOCUS32902 [Linum perenne]